MVVAPGMESVPLPPMVPPLQVIAVEVRLMFAVPLRVPPFIVSVGTLRVPALLSVRVPPDMVIEVERLLLTVLVPALHCSVPAPLVTEEAWDVARGGW